MAKLYELTNDIKALEEYFDRLEEIEDEDKRFEAENALLFEREQIRDDLSHKIEGICQMIKNNQSDIDAIADEINRLQDRKKSLENKITNIKNYVQNCLEYAGESKVVTASFTCTITNNPPSLSIPDESIVPAEYLIAQPPKVNKNAIKQAIKDGAKYDWCELVQNRSIRIK